MNYMMSGQSTIIELQTSPHLTPNPLSDILERGRDEVLTLRVF